MCILLHLTQVQSELFRAGHLFKGSDKRKPNGFAEVSITLDNEDGALPINFNEVQIARRLYRSGESRYSINGAECRLKDITNLFLDSGIGKYGYSIIGQGRVLEILNATPEGRRYIFDEAAGIMKYKTRKDEAQKHLFLTEENLSRANDLIFELEGSLPQLKIAAEKAEKYITVAEKLKKCETTRFVLLHNRYKESEERLQSQIELLNNDISQNENAKKDSEEKLLHVNERHDTVFDQCEKLRSNRVESVRTAERLKGELKYTVDRITQLKKDSEINADSIKRYKEEADSLSGVIASELEKRKDAVAVRDENEKILAEHSESVEKIRKEYNAVIESLANERINNTELSGKENVSQLKLTELTTRHRMLLEQKNTSQQAANEEAEHFAEMSTLSEEAKESVNKAAQSFEDAKKAYADASAAYDKANIDYSKKSAELEALAKTAESQKSRIATLNELKESMESFNNSTKAVIRLKNSNKPFAGDIIGTVSDIIRVDKKYETAIEVALGAAVQNIVTKTDTAAKEIIEYLRNNRLGYATFLPLNSVQGRTVNDADRRTLSQKGFCGIACELIKYSGEYTNVIHNLLGRVVIAENMDAAIGIARASRYMFRIVTLEGDVINPYGSISGGSRGKSNISNVFSRSREIDELSEGLKSNVQAMKLLAATLSELKENSATLKKNADEKQAELHNKEIEYTSAKKGCEYILSEYEKAKLAKNQRDMNNTSAEQELGRIEENIKTIRKQLEDCKLLVLKSNSDMSRLVSEEARLKVVLTDAETKLTDLKLKQMECENKIQVITSSYEDAFNRQKERYAQTEQLRNSNEEMQNELTDSTARAEDLKKQIESVEAAEEKEAELLKKCEEDLRSLEKLKKQREDEIRAYESMLLDISAKLHDFDMSKAKVMMESDNLQSRMWEVYQVSLGDALAAEKEEGDIEELNKKIRDVKSEITRMGPINPEAPEQYQTQSQRWKKLCDEKEDLLKASRDIEKLIAEITKEMRIRFDEEFKIINEYFTEMFKKLFNGGVAHLELCNSDDILEAGIDIIAQPPGKKLQNISLMSGGEKTLIAIALLFALLKRRPAPFCILDEIDTALDEKNVYTLANLVKTFGNTQFIIISHRKGTMEASNALYGVSMAEKGVSSLLSVQLEE